MIDQLGILVLGVGAVFLTQYPSERTKKIAPIVGLLSQPFWLYASWRAGQWGIFMSNLCYTGAWSYGIYTQWFKSKPTTVKDPVKEMHPVAVDGGLQ